MLKCPKCGIVFREGEMSIWCAFNTCPTTDQRQPTYQQAVNLGLIEKDSDERKAA